MTWRTEPRRIDQPRPGAWLVRLVRGGPLVPARIFWCDHEPGEPDNKLDQPFLDAEINGKRVDPLKLWEMRGRAVPLNEIAYRDALRKWAQENAPDDPAANPDQPIDHLTVKPPF